MTEFEKKLLLTKKDYELLLARFGCERTIKQINSYFDTEDLAMNRENVTCRIRSKDGKYEGRMKRHAPNGDQSTEIKIKIYDGLRHNTFTDMGLKLQGSLTTERHVIQRCDGIEAVLDKNEYLDETDYELEVEYSPNQEKEAKALFDLFCSTLAQNQRTPKNQESYQSLSRIPSKSNRFFTKKTKTNATKTCAN